MTDGRSPRVIVIGAGMGGLAAAMRLSHRGFATTVLEKNDTVGGRSAVFEQNGYRIDTGPTILVMLSYLEDTYQSVGLDMRSRLDVRRIEPNYRILYHDGDRIDLASSMPDLSGQVERIESGAAARLSQFLGDSARRYELGIRFVERNYDRLTDLMSPRAASWAISTRALTRLYDDVSRYFQSDKLRKAFSFHSMFLGLSPYDAPAMYTMITWADLVLGMWHVIGGVYRIVEDMATAASELGAEIITGRAVRKIDIVDGKVRGVILDDGDYISADVVLSNADLVYSYRELVDAEHRHHYPDQRLDRMEYACSGYVLCLALDRTYGHVPHQSLYFAEDYRANLNAIFREKAVPHDPSFHLNMPTATDPSLAPPGCSTAYILAPMPNLSTDVKWSDELPRVRETLMRRLEGIVDPRLREHVVWQKEITPSDWLSRVNAPFGTAFGSLSHRFFQSSYFRPHNKARDIRGLYFVGQATYPGVGVPMVHLSARLATERIIAEWT